MAIPTVRPRKPIHMLVAPLCAVTLSAGIAASVTIHRAEFDAAVNRSHEQTDRYDDKFISLVDNMERELAQRASFGYSGGKDPITGVSRRVVSSAPLARANLSDKSADNDVVDAPRPDPVKLTAIIYDGKSKTYTAIIMDGERSFSVDVGDKVRGRTVRSISAEQTEMADESYLYTYDIFGRKSCRPRIAKGVLGLLDGPSFGR